MSEDIERLNAMRTETMVEHWSADGESGSQRIPRYKIDIATNYTEGWAAPGWVCSIRDWQETGAKADSGFYAAVRGDLLDAVRAALAKMDEARRLKVVK